MRPDGKLMHIPQRVIKEKKLPRKVLRHFPLIPRLQKLYAVKSTAKDMRWHAEERNDDGILRHPADSDAWKDFDNKHVEYALEPRNVRLWLLMGSIHLGT